MKRSPYWLLPWILLAAACSPPYVSLDAKPPNLCGPGTSTLIWKTDKVTNIKLSFSPGPGTPSGQQNVNVTSTSTYEITGESSLGPRQDFATVNVARRSSNLTAKLLYRQCTGNRAVYETDNFLPAEEIHAVKNLQNFWILLAFKGISHPMAAGSNVPHGLRRDSGRHLDRDDKTARRRGLSAALVHPVATSTGLAGINRHQSGLWLLLTAARSVAPEVIRREGTSGREPGRDEPTRRDFFRAFPVKAEPMRTRVAGALQQLGF